jgi:hypothetical protein
MQKQNHQAGLQLFSKYAFAPNTLKYCGPKETEIIFEELCQNAPGKNTRKNFKNLLLQFNGAIPYLELIARANNIRDIFDYRVVEAYWLGNSLLSKVTARNFYSSVEGRFKKRINSKEWAKITIKPAKGSKPFHAFHVFDIGSKIGLINLGKAPKSG